MYNQVSKYQFYISLETWNNFLHHRDLISFVLNTIVINPSYDFFTNMGWLLQSHDSIDCLEWFINPRLSLAFNNFSSSFVLLPHITSHITPWYHHAEAMAFCIGNCSSKFSCDVYQVILLFQNCYSVTSRNNTND